METEKTFNTVNLNIIRVMPFYLQSNGFYDQVGGKTGKKYKKSALNKFIAGISEQSMEKQKDLLENELKQWMGK